MPKRYTGSSFFDVKNLYKMENSMSLQLNESRQIYISKINEVQDYIEKHLNEALNIQQLAQISNFSEYHFQRIFKSITGESLYGFIKRLRLEKAVFLLRSNHRLSVQDVAFDVGFSTQAAFAKALKERFGMNASGIRNLDDSQLNQLMCEVSRNGKVFLDTLAYTEPIRLNIQAIEPTRVLYLRHTGAYKGNSNLFMDLFTKLYNFASKRNLLSAQTKWYTVYHDYSDLTHEEKLRMSICISVEASTKPHGEFNCMEIQGGKYAVGHFLIHEDAYQTAWNYMILKWLPESGYMPDDRLCFEYYPPRENENDSTRRLVEIFIPIQPL